MSDESDLLSVEAIDGEWQSALADAGLTPRRVQLFLRDGSRAPVSGAGAIWHLPGAELAEGEHSPKAKQLTYANDAGVRHLHRIVLWRGHDGPTVGALLRHELEHARQWDGLGPCIFELQDLILAVAAIKVDRLEGCAGGVINATPLEHDCNAAAAMWLQEHHPEAVATMRASDHRHLTCSVVGPEPFDTLPGRSIAHLAQFPTQCRARERQTGLTLADELDARYVGAGKLWRSLTSASAQLRRRR